ncbi:Elongation factor G [Tepidanaerobacter acetatoxydans Re1]|uniref:Elongation factor G n=1 Tax=Tepidanaerobacter acetatoxydans (strain DSM 21804 / JCM 16047 / Re1) TaxID=1209989 RepID=F4LRW8_TEPAE|nr:elongation factor G [Tepidanaerobacter acetatoxydans]AEE92307.1 translation elongation factor G [Tepidanaerobacter acetatoxydans Re1]CCP27188.1 Elongation factor G [Tepidanaerobacter acetatoxydans Re1]
MKNYKSDMIRNIGLIGHSGSGKTSLAEAMLYNSGSTDRLGKIDEGNTICDYDPEEIKRRISISNAIAPCEWKDNKINIIDTPGYFDFVGEVKSALRVVENAVIAVCAVSGVEVGTEQVFKYAEDANLPRIFFINKMDRENANFNKVLDQIREFFGPKAVPLQLPIGSEANFNGIVDIVSEKAYSFADKNLKECAVPEDLKDTMAKYRSALLEAVAETDDDILMKYLEGEELTDTEIEKGLRKGIISGDIFPILCGSSLTNKGINLLLDVICNYAASPQDRPDEIGVKPGTDEEIIRKCSADEPFSALVFKTMADPYVGKLTLFKVFSGSVKSDTSVYNVTQNQTEKFGQIYALKGKKQENITEVLAGDIAAVAKLQYTTTNDTLADKENPILLKPIDFPKPVLTLAAQPKSSGDEDKISSGLARLMEEDKTFEVSKDPETSQLLVSGMGEIHLEVLAAKLANKFGSEIVLEPPKIPYRETIRETVKVEGKHKKQSGGRGQYGHVWLELQPTDLNEEFQFEDKIFGGAVPKQYVPAVEKGIREALKEGVLAGYPMIGIKAILYDGSFHPVDSSEMAFKIAGSMAFKKGALQAKPVLLEPIMDLTVVVPENFMGDIIGDLNKRRGRVLGMDQKDGMQHIKAQVPMSEILRYATDLRSMTQGRGSFVSTFSHYEEVPAMIAEKIIAETKNNKE